MCQNTIIIFINIIIITRLPFPFIFTHSSPLDKGLKLILLPLATKQSTILLVHPGQPGAWTFSVTTFLVFHFFMGTYWNVECKVNTEGKTDID